MTVEDEFNRKRRMFAIVDGTVHIAPAGDRRGHLAWMIETKLLQGYDDPTFRQIVRGYALDGKLVGYRGPDFRGGRTVRDTMIANLGALMDGLGLTPDTLFYTGARMAEVGDIWIGAERWGTIQEVRDQFAERISP